VRQDGGGRKYVKGVRRAAFQIVQNQNDDDMHRRMASMTTRGFRDFNSLLALHALAHAATPAVLLFPTVTWYATHPLLPSHVVPPPASVSAWLGTSFHQSVGGDGGPGGGGVGAETWGVKSFVESPCVCKTLVGRGSSVSSCTESPVHRSVGPSSPTTSPVKARVRMTSIMTPSYTWAIRTMCTCVRRDSRSAGEPWSCRLQ
jgi:hypothetical protein